MFDTQLFCTPSVFGQNESRPAAVGSGEPGRSGHSQTTTYITAVAYCCLVVVVWQRIWLISMLPIVIVYYFFKRVGEPLEVGQRLCVLVRFALSWCCFFYHHFFFFFFALLSCCHHHLK